jgi:putative FmdB family regulatory protein
MPIYAYKCTSCGHAKDVLQKMSDAPLAVCPACGATTFQKQVTAAGFQLKGSGWYVTDFRNGQGGATAAAAEAKPEPKTGGESSGKAGDTSPATPAAAPVAAPATPAPAAAPSSATPGAGSSS